MAVLTAILLGCTLFVASAQAQVSTLPINKCLSGKIGGVGKSQAGHSRCLSKETSQGALDPGCHQKASEKFTGGEDPTKGVFNKLDAKFPIDGAASCRTFADQDSFEERITSYAAGVSDTTGNGTGECDAAKIKCLGKYVAALAKCAAKAAGTSGMIETACTDKATSKLADGTSGCLDEAALESDCTHAGSQAAVLQASADAFIQDALCALDPGNAACASTTTLGDTSTTTTSTTILVDTTTTTEPTTTTLVIDTTTTAEPTTTTIVVDTTTTDTTSTTIVVDTTTTTETTSTTIVADTTTTTQTTTTTLPACTTVTAPPALAAGTFIRYTRGEEQRTRDIDPALYSDPEANALSNSDPAAFDASNFIDPAVCNSTAADLTFHWEITYPPVAGITNPFTLAGITGYRRVRLEIGWNTLIAQTIPPVNFKLTVVSRLTGLSTIVNILSQVSESSLSMTVFNSCKGQAMACDECICTNAAALATREPT
ncbi:MAG TPA: hypothetical protein VEL28_23050 [Candidatus Binatia bacterium]|nr:hypothetical protein [Candidatus Binatia bacterium]